MAVKNDKKKTKIRKMEDTGVDIEFEGIVNKLELVNKFGIYSKSEGTSVVCDTIPNDLEDKMVKVKITIDRIDYAKK